MSSHLTGPKSDPERGHRKNNPITNGAAKILLQVVRDKKFPAPPAHERLALDGKRFLSQKGATEKQWAEVLADPRVKALRGGKPEYQRPTVEFSEGIHAQPSETSEVKPHGGTVRINPHHLLTGILFQSVQNGDYNGLF